MALVLRPMAIARAVLRMINRLDCGGSVRSRLGRCADQFDMHDEYRCADDQGGQEMAKSRKHVQSRVGRSG